MCIILTQHVFVQYIHVSVASLMQKHIESYTEPYFVELEFI